jgi:hypothetical protein
MTLQVHYADASNWGFLAVTLKEQSLTPLRTFQIHAWVSARKETATGCPGEGSTSATAGRQFSGAGVGGRRSRVRGEGESRGEAGFAWRYLPTEEVPLAEAELEAVLARGRVGGAPRVTLEPVTLDSVDAPGPLARFD